MSHATKLFKIYSGVLIKGARLITCSATSNPICTLPLDALPRKTNCSNIPTLGLYVSPARAELLRSLLVPSNAAKKTKVLLLTAVLALLAIFLDLGLSRLDLYGSQWGSVCHIGSYFGYLLMAGKFDAPFHTKTYAVLRPAIRQGAAKVLSNR